MARYIYRMFSVNDEMRDRHEASCINPVGHLPEGRALTPADIGKRFWLTKPHMRGPNYVYSFPYLPHEHNHFRLTQWVVEPDGVKLVVEMFTYKDELEFVNEEISMFNGGFGVGRWGCAIPETDKPVLQLYEDWLADVAKARAERERRL